MTLLLLLVVHGARADVPAPPESSCKCAATTPAALAPLLLAAALPALVRRRR